MNARRLLVLLPMFAMLGLNGCGNIDASEAPTDASVDDFCEVIEDFAGLEPSVGESVRGWDTDFKNWPKKLVEVGTPADMTDQERRGFEVYVTTYDEWHGRSGYDRNEDLSEDDNDAWDAFYVGYVYRHCEPYGEHE